VRVLVVVALVGALLASTASAKDGPGQKEKPERISARAFVAIDAATGRVLLARRSTTRMPIASLTKVMTALVVIERGDLARKVRATEEAVNVEDYREGLRPGRWYPREALLWSSLSQSGNDSATALALDAGGGSLQAFYDLMNAKARQLGMQQTTYASPSGLDDTVNLSTAYDQAILARAALRNETFAEMVGTRFHRIAWPYPTVAKEMVNHNKMLATAPGTYGVKTGWTTAAGGCLTVAQRRNGRDVIAVVLGSWGIWHDMPLLLDKAFAKLERLPAG
jgi:D-alanyl-D-alanine carboxypeptidase